MAYQRAEAALALRRWDDAIRFAAEAVASEPLNALYRGQLARGLMGAKRFGEALAEVGIGLSCDPENTWLFRLRGWVFFHTRDFERAHQAVHEAIRLDPEDGDAYALRASIFDAQNRPKEAEAAARKAIELEPGDWDHRATLADVILTKRPAEAEQIYRGCLGEHPADARLLNNLGVALLNQGRKREAVTAFKAALLLDPTLDYAKQNAHDTLSDWLTGGLGTGFAVVAISQIIRLLLVELGNPLVAMLVGVGALAAYLLGIRTYKARRLRELEREDPQLRRIYEQLVRDKKGGRL